jgi:serine/threonine protein kinase
MGDQELHEPLTDVRSGGSGGLGEHDDDAETGRFAGRVARPDEYKLITRVARGGEGFVWRAEYQGTLPRSVDFAIKQFVAPPGIPQSDWPPPDLIDRWFEQLKLLQLVHDDHVVGYRETFSGWPPHLAAGDSDKSAYFGEPPVELRTWYLVMEWVDGPTLHQLVSEGRLSLAARIELIGELAGAIDHLHSGANTRDMALLHRDIKPGNIIVHPSRGAVLVDFGLLRVEEPAITEIPMWTGPYLAPEVHANKARSSRASDSWSLAATAFFALTAEHPSPMDCGLMRDQLRAALHGRVADPETVIEVLMSVLDKPPESRPRTASEWAGQLRDAIGGVRSPRPKRSGASWRRWRRLLWVPLIGLLGVASYFLVSGLTNGAGHGSSSASNQSEFTAPYRAVFTETFTNTGTGSNFSGTVAGGIFSRGTYTGLSETRAAPSLCGESPAVPTLTSLVSTAANGDILRETHDGTLCQSTPSSLEYSGTYTIRGGTGCLAGAAGTGHTSAHIVLPTTALPVGAAGSDVSTDDGSIILKRLPHCPQSYPRNPPEPKVTPPSR